MSETDDSKDSDGYLQHREMSPADIAEYFKQHAPQAQQGDEEGVAPVEPEAP